LDGLRDELDCDPDNPLIVDQCHPPTSPQSSL
jgi:hypothetical protein